MGKTTQREARRVVQPNLPKQQPNSVLDVNQALMNAALRYQTEGLERVRRMAHDCLAFGIKRMERDTAFRAELAQARNSHERTVLCVEFLRTAQHGYLDEISRQMEILASATSDAVTVLEAQLDHSEDVIEHAIAEAEAVPV